MTVDIIKGRERDTQNKTTHEKMEANTGVRVRLTQIRACLGPPEAE
jgi:hypothetical protein